MNLQKGKLDYEDYFERGKMHFYNEKYRKAKSDFSEYLIRLERLRRVSDIKDITSHSKEKAHFLRAISNFHLSNFNTQKEFNNDNKYLINNREKNGSFYTNFLLILMVTHNANQHGNDKNQFEYAIGLISQCLYDDDATLDDFDDYLIHLPLDFQVIFKMYFH